MNIVVTDDTIVTGARLDFTGSGFTPGASILVWVLNGGGSYFTANSLGNIAGAFASISEGAGTYYLRASPNGGASYCEDVFYVSAATSSTISVFTRDSGTYAVLPGVAVTLGGITKTSGSNGLAGPWTGLLGSQVLTAKISGYNDHSSTVTVVSGTNADPNIYMVKQAVNSGYCSGIFFQKDQYYYDDNGDLPASGIEVDGNAIDVGADFTNTSGRAINVRANLQVFCDGSFVWSKYNATGVNNNQTMTFEMQGPAIDMEGQWSAEVYFTDDSGTVLATTGEVVLFNTEMPAAFSTLRIVSTTVN